MYTACVSVGLVEARYPQTTSTETQARTTPAHTVIPQGRVQYQVSVDVCLCERWGCDRGSQKLHDSWAPAYCLHCVLVDANIVCWLPVGPCITLFTACCTPSFQLSPCLTVCLSVCCVLFVCFTHMSLLQCLVLNTLTPNTQHTHTPSHTGAAVDAACPPQVSWTAE